jgi:CheY-like chemotaxis protein
MARVLVVEDHADSLEAMSLLLKLTGYEVTTAVNGREALASVIDRTPDVLLLDLSMPEMDGVQLIQTVRSYHRLSSLPVVVLTGTIAGRLYDEAKSLNVNSLLIKSAATFDQIRAALEEALSQTLADPRMHAPEKWRGDSISPL